MTQQRFSVYVASALANAPASRTFARLLHAHGFPVVSTWHDVVTGAESDPCDHVTRRETAQQCVAEVMGAWCTVLLLGPEGLPKGAYFEAGVAASSGAPVLWVYAPRSDHTVVGSLFDSLPGSSVHMTVQEAVGHLVDMRKLETKKVPS